MGGGGFARGRVGGLVMGVGSGLGGQAGGAESMMPL